MTNHAKAIVACDFAVSMTLSFEIVYIFVAMELGSRRILHVNTTHHPTADWTAQQLRCSVDTERHRYLLHDRDAIFSAGLDASFERLGVTIRRAGWGQVRKTNLSPRIVDCWSETGLPLVGFPDLAPTNPIRPFLTELHRSGPPNDLDPTEFALI